MRWRVNFSMICWFGVFVMLCVAVVFVHAFMENLSLFPGMFAAGSSSDDESCSGEGYEGGLFHEGVKEESVIVEAESLRAMVFSDRMLSLDENYRCASNSLVVPLLGEKSEHRRTLWARKSDR